MKFHRFAEVWPALAADEFAELLADISRHGVREPVWLFEGEILDGRHRWTAAQMAGVACPTRQWLGDSESAFALTQSSNKRRNLTPGQKAAVALKILPIEEEFARERMLAGTKAKPADPAPDEAQEPAAEQAADPTANLPGGSKGEAREKAAAKTGASARNVQNAKRLQEHRPDLLAKVEAGTMSMHAAMRQMADDEKKKNLERPVQVDMPDGIVHGDFRTMSASIPDESVDLVFTDPPYDADSVGLYEDAARIAARILKPGGSFIAYSGQRHLPAVLAGTSKHLRYWWTIAGVHDGGNQLLQKLGIRCGWKPLVWFVKDTRADVQNIIMDVVRGDREKDQHQWQQAQSEAEYYVGELCSEGGVVVDFCVGGGTTAAACKALGRRFIGFDVDAQSIERTVERLSK